MINIFYEHELTIFRSKTCSGPYQTYVVKFFVKINNDF